MRRIFRIIKYIILLAVLFCNVIACNHAYQFTHFKTKDIKKTKKPEHLSLGEKISTLFWGVSLPKPSNHSKPSRAFETVSIQSHEKLEGWLVEVDSSKGTVILFHGYGSSKSGIINYSDEFNELGFSTLAMDFMGSGGSEGYQTTVGYKESKDVKESFEYIKNRFPDQPVVIFGPSMGAVAIMKAFQDYKIQPDKIILECPFSTMVRTTKTRFEAMNLPSFPMAHLLLFYGGLQNGFNPYRHRPVDYAQAISSPTLLLHGRLDQRVSEEEIQNIFKNISTSKELHILERSGHENYLKNEKENWVRFVSAFLEK